MKSICLSVMMFMVVSSNVFADSGKTARKVASSSSCNASVEAKAVQIAESKFGGLCGAGKPSYGKLRTNPNGDQIGNISVICHNHVSPISVVTEVHVFDFTAANECSSINVVPQTEDES